MVCDFNWGIKTDYSKIAINSVFVGSFVQVYFRYYDQHA